MEAIKEIYSTEINDFNKVALELFKEGSETQKAPSGRSSEIALSNIPRIFNYVNPSYPKIGNAGTSYLCVGRLV